jgi:hypothetical protein
VEDAPYNEKLSFIIKWIVVILFVLMLFVIYIPNNIWAKEKQIRKLAHWKMTQLWDAQRMYHALTNSYNDDLRATLRFVSQVRDSILADSMYTGEQYINFQNNRIKIKIPNFWDYEYDTTFAFPYEATDTTYETIYTAAVPNPQTGLKDTIYLNKRRDTYVYKDSLWEGQILDTALDIRVEKVEKYKRFNLVDSLLICPLTKEEYYTERTKDNKIRIVSPTRGGVRFPVYHFWTFEDTGHGYIEDGEKSWAKF